MIFGDMNSLNPIWYDGNLDARGMTIQSVIETTNLAVLNEDQPTYYRALDHTTSHVDLTLITDSCPADYTWVTREKMHGSNHYPIMMTSIQSPHREHSERWNLEKADWSSYSNLAVTIKRVAEQPDIDQALKHMSETILEDENL